MNFFGWMDSSIEERGEMSKIKVGTIANICIYTAFCARIWKTATHNDGKFGSFLLFMCGTPLIGLFSLENGWKMTMPVMLTAIGALNLDKLPALPASNNSLLSAVCMGGLFIGGLEMLNWSFNQKVQKWIDERKSQTSDAK